MEAKFFILPPTCSGAYLVGQIPLPDLKRSDGDYEELGFGLQRDLDSEYGDYYPSFDLEVNTFFQKTSS